ncbi:MAG TPA: nucleotide sugar dehydrogenase [Bryobacteraceae bacterium]|nr:nucleotide sugar dehydrogenase [Bryobacteraceae bacterium]
MKISIVGMGKLGSPMLVVMAYKGHTVVGVDVNPRFVEAIQAGKAPVREPGLQEMIYANRERISATASYEEAILRTDITMIIVPTPSGPDGRFSMSYVLSSAEQIGAALKKKKDWHLVVLSSTVMPGSTEGVLLPALEKFSGKKCGRDFGLCYNPEFIALGSVIRDMLNPDMILIGEADDRSGAILEELYTGVCESNPHIRRMNYVNAELTKLSVNTFVTTKISYANMLAQVCETLPGADVDVVTAAVGCDSRIGQKYMKGALGYGGPCFPRDNKAFSALARANGAPALLAEATDKLNSRQVPRLGVLILSRLPKGGVAGIMGLSYKPNTEVIEESQGVALAKYLSEAGASVVVYDPAAMDNTRLQLKDSVSYAKSAADCASQADVLAITTPWPEFKNLAPENFKRGAAMAFVLDCWRILPHENLEGVVDYRTLGYGATDGARDREQVLAAEGD